MIDPQRIKALIENYLAGKLTETERSELDQWINESQHNRELFERLTDEKRLFEAAKESISADERISRKLIEEHPELAVLAATPAVPVRKMIWFKMASAAAVVIVMATATYVGYKWLSGKKDNKVVVTETPAPVTDKAPGKDGAILKLSNGEEIVLDDAANGNLAKQGNTQITKQGALLAYNNKGKNTEVVYNTLTTPRGRQFQLALPDGSRVWLNAASSIKFPTAFTGNNREVIISGEVYLEVKKDAAKPFKVLAGSSEIDVLGTHFNVNAYRDEAALKTTLIEGKVQIVNRQSSMVNEKITLKPGQQAQVRENKIEVIDNADINATLAWKNGLIVFSSADIKEVLRQVSRWYDVDIEYKSNIKVPEFYGEIPRSVNLSDVLKIIELNSKLRFTLAGNKVTVTQP
jgi:transmembrane sensor